ncbi:hypothetical protein H5410_030633, partial [Solanum commersonii]
NPKDYEGGQIEEIISLILHKVKEHDRVLKEIKDNILMLNQMTASHSISIQLLETQMGHMLSSLYLRQQEGCLVALWKTQIIKLDLVSEPNFVRRLTPKLTGDPVKLDEVSIHSACRRVVRRSKLISPKGRDLDGQKSSNGQFWPNQGNSEYPSGMGHMGLGLIDNVGCLILFSGGCRFDFWESGLKNCTLGSLVSRIELAKPLGSSRYPILSPLVSCFD